MRQLRSLSLGAKINIGLLLFLLLLAGAASAIMFYGFRRAQDDASARSEQALEEQGELVLQALVGGVSNSGGLQIEWAAEIGHRGSRYLTETDAIRPPASVDVSRYVRTEDGVWYDPDPARMSDLVVPNHVEQLTPDQVDDIIYSAALDPLLPALVEGFPGELSGEGFRPIAVVFSSSNGIVRYYPPIGVHETTPAEVDFSPMAGRFGPQGNPGRETIWVPPYEDTLGRGLVMTAQTPVYQGDVFRGIFEVDLSIDGLAAELDGIHPTPGGFAFYVDTEGEILRSDAFDLLSREAGTNATLAAVLEDMRVGAVEGPRSKVENVTLANRDYFISYYPLPSAGGSIAVAAPVDEVTEQAAAITASISDEGTRTLQIMLAALSALFIAGLTGATYLNRQFLLQPLRTLASATRQVAGGDLKANVALERRDELGELASDFNTMVEQLRESERVLEQRVEERTRELETLLEVSRNVASWIELEPLLESVLDQVRAVADYDRGSVQVFEDGEFTVRAVRDFGHGVDYQTQMRVGMRLPIPGDPIWSQFLANEPIILNDVNEDSPLARTYRSRLHSDVDQARIPDGSFLAIPLISQGRIVGSISVGRDETNFYTADHARLARAIASQVAIAIENARLYETAQQQARELSTLLEVARNVSSSTEFEPLLELVLDQLSLVVDYDRAVVWVHEANSLVIRAARDLAGPGDYVTSTRIGDRLDASNEALPSWFTGDEPVIIDDVCADTPEAREYRAQLRPDRASDPPPGSYMGIPLFVQDRVVGMLALARDQPGYYTLEHARLGRAIGSQIAVAIDNVRLFEETRRSARETEALLRADRELFGTLNLDEVLQALVDVAVDVLGADKSVVVLHQGTVDVVRAARNHAPDNLALFNQALSTMPHEEPPPENQTPQVYIDAETEAPEFVRAALTREGIRSHISVPVKDAKRMLGVFGVSFVVEHAFTDEEQRSYVALADRAAVAIQNAELYEKAQHAASLEERQRLARELHDSVSQALYGIALGARTARLRIDEDPLRAAEPIDYVTSLAEAGLAEMRALIFELRPESLESEGLVVAIDKLVASARARHQLAISFESINEPECRLDVKEAWYRITQEALNNIAKHAQATNVEVCLSIEDGVLVLTIADDGRGFDATASYPGHVGLLSMPERAKKVGGDLTIASAPGNGTRVVARVPL